MYFHSRPLAVGTHGGIILGEAQIDGGNPRPSRRYRLYYPQRHVLKQLRGFGHLCLYHIIQVGIADGVGEVVAFRRLNEIISHIERNSEVRPHCPLLGHHPVKGMEADIV